MSDNLDSTGITVKTLPTLVSEESVNFQNIYGSDINLNSNSPDAQMINIFAQGGTDVRELLMNIYNSFSRDNCSGIQLDQRVALIGIKRIGATFTIQPITLVVDRPVSLQGLDNAIDDVNGVGYTIADNANNQWILTDSINLSAGTYALNFRASQIGLVETIPNTITVPITIVLGVNSINNPSQATIIGQDQETDFELRTRADRSTANTALAQVDSLRGNLLALNGVAQAFCYENLSASIDSNGILPNGIWAIVEGGDNNQIAQVIYSQLNSNNMKGSTAIPISTSSGETFITKFDRPLNQNLYIQFNLKSTVTGTNYDLAGITDYIVENLVYDIQEYAETSKVTQIASLAIESTTGGGVPIDVKISSDNINYVDYIPAPSLNSEWLISSNNIFITIV